MNYMSYPPHLSWFIQMIKFWSSYNEDYNLLRYNAMYQIQRKTVGTCYVHLQEGRMFFQDVVTYLLNHMISHLILSQSHLLSRKLSISYRHYEVCDKWRNKLPGFTVTNYLETTNSRSMNGSLPQISHKLLCLLLLYLPTFTPSHLDILFMWILVTWSHLWTSQHLSTSVLGLLA